MTSTAAPRAAPHASASPWWHGLGDRLGLLLPAAGALLVITRVYIAAGRDPGTALAVLRSAGLVSTVLGVVTSLLPALAAVVATGLALLAAHDLRAGRRPGRAGLAVAVGVLAAAFIPVEAGTLTRLAVLLVPPGVALALGYGGLLQPAALWGAAVVGMLGLNILTSSALWLPAERLTVRAADGTSVDHIGYVLTQQEDVVELLTHDPRLVLRVADADVRVRVVCRLTAGDGGDDRESILSWVLTRLDVPSPRGGAPDC